MKLWLEIDYSIDGEASREQVNRAIFFLTEKTVATSEELGEGDDYAIIINERTIWHDDPRGKRKK